MAKVYPVVLGQIDGEGCERGEGRRRMGRGEKMGREEGDEYKIRGSGRGGRGREERREEGKERREDVSKGGDS